MEFLINRNLEEDDLELRDIVDSLEKRFIKQKSITNKKPKLLISRSKDDDKRHVKKTSSKNIGRNFEDINAMSDSSNQDDLQRLLSEIQADTDKGNFDDAKSKLNEALTIQNAQSHIIIYRKLGECHRSEGDFSAAISAYSKAVSLNEREPITYIELGKTYYEKLLKFKDSMDEIEQSSVVNMAIKYYQYAIEYGGTKFIQARMELGNLKKELGELDEAESHYRHITLLDPSNVGAFENAGDVCILQGFYSRAIRYFLQAHYLKPHSWDVLLNLSYLYCKSGDTLEARRYTSEIPNSQVQTRTKYEKAQLNALKAWGNSVEYDSPVMIELRSVIDEQPDQQGKQTVLEKLQKDRFFEYLRDQKEYESFISGTGIIFLKPIPFEKKTNTNSTVNSKIVRRISQAGKPVYLLFGCDLEMLDALKDGLMNLRQELLDDQYAKAWCRIGIVFGGGNETFFSSLVDVDILTPDEIVRDIDNINRNVNNETRNLHKVLSVLDASLKNDIIEYSVNEMGDDRVAIFIVSELPTNTEWIYHFETLVHEHQSKIAEIYILFAGDGTKGFERQNLNVPSSIKLDIFSETLSSELFYHFGWIAHRIIKSLSKKFR